MKKLIPMTDFVIEQMYIDNFDEDTLKIIYNYAKFLKQKIELWMFIPCRLGKGEWIPLEKPQGTNLDNSFSEMVIDYNKEVAWELAKECCLFEGFEIRDKGNFYFIEKKDSSLWYRLLKKNSKVTIEDLLKFSNVELTPTAIKQIGL